VAHVEDRRDRDRAADNREDHRDGRGVGGKRGRSQPGKETRDLDGPAARRAAPDAGRHHQCRRRHARDAQAGGVGPASGQVRPVRSGVRRGEDHRPAEHREQAAAEQRSLGPGVRRTGRKCDDGREDSREQV
jgi:hypothetical protein